MAYKLPTYRTVVNLSYGCKIGTFNKMVQPGGFVRGLPSPFWCRDAFQWQILVYETSTIPANLQDCTAALKIRKLNAQEDDITLATAVAAEGYPGSYNSLTFNVAADQIEPLTYSGETMCLYVEIYADAASTGSVGLDVRTSFYQPLELLGPSGDNSNVDYAPVPAGRWRGDYDDDDSYWVYDTVRYGYGIWMNIAAGGSTGEEPPADPADIENDYWTLIIYDYTGAWLDSLAETKQDDIDSAAAFTDTVDSTTRIYLEGQAGTVSQLWTYLTTLVTGAIDASCKQDDIDSATAFTDTVDSTTRIYLEGQAGTVAQLWAYLTTLVTGAIDASGKQDDVNTADAFAGSMADSTEVFLDGKVGTGSTVWTWIMSKLAALLTADGSLLVRTSGAAAALAPGSLGEHLVIGVSGPEWAAEDSTAASEITYSADPLYWFTTSPDTVEEALDDMAVRVAVFDSISENDDIDSGTEVIDSYEYDGTFSIWWMVSIYQASTNSMRTMQVGAHVVRSGTPGSYSYEVEYLEGPGPDDIGTVPAGGLFSVTYNETTHAAELKAATVTDNWVGQARKFGVLEF